MWEYQTLKLGGSGFLWASFDWNQFNERLNIMGGEGWELVSLVDANYSQGVSGYFIAVLKRPLQRQ